MKLFFKKLTPLILLLSLSTVLLCSCKTNGADSPDGSSTSVQPSGIIAKAEKYEYKGEDVMLIHVENRSDKNYLLTVDGHFYDEGGNELRTRSANFAGFPAGFENYFVLQPGICFDSFDYEITTEVYKYKPLADHLTLPTKIEFFTSPVWLNGSDVVSYGTDFDPSKLYAGVWAHPYPFVSTYTGPLKLSGHFVMFDSSGEIHMIEYFHSYAISNYTDNSGPVFQCYVYDTPMEYGVSYQVPDKLKNTRWLFALTGIDTIY